MIYTIKSDIGVVRSENQDRAAVFKKGNQTLAILCDGMGGHEGGSYASSIVINNFEKSFIKKIDPKEIVDWFEKTINSSKKEMIKFANNNNKNLLDMGTTLTAALIDKTNIYIFNIGDSRTYAYNGLLHQITKDHNLRNFYINEYGYSPEEAAKNVRMAALTSALGPNKKTEVNSFIIKIEKKLKYIILTSDGIHDYISKPNFEKLLNSSYNLDKKALEIIKQAIRGKSSDNLSIIIIDLLGEK